MPEKLILVPAAKSFGLVRNASRAAANGLSDDIPQIRADLVLAVLGKTVTGGALFRNLRARVDIGRGQQGRDAADRRNFRFGGRGCLNRGFRFGGRGGLGGRFFRRGLFRHDQRIGGFLDLAGPIQDHAAVIGEQRDHDAQQEGHGDVCFKRWIFRHGPYFLFHLLPIAGAVYSLRRRKSTPVHTRAKIRRSQHPERRQ
jgi:hypothetical protein